MESQADELRVEFEGNLRDRYSALSVDFNTLNSVKSDKTYSYLTQY